MIKAKRLPIPNGITLCFGVHRQPWPKAYLKKGDAVIIEGKLASRNYNDKDGVKRYVTEVVVNEFVKMGSKANSSYLVLRLPMAKADGNEAVLLSLPLSQFMRDKHSHRRAFAISFMKLHLRC
jgi:hypothetical protein